MSVPRLMSCVHRVHVISRNADYGYFGTFAGEILGQFVIFTLWLVGAAISTVSTFATLDSASMK